MNKKFLIFSVLFFLLCLVAFLSSTMLDNKFNDSFTKTYLKLVKTEAPSNIVIVAVDDKSIDEISWPWKRKLFSDIFNYLEFEAQAKSIVFQNVISFSDSYNKESDTLFYKSILNNKKLINSYILVNSNLTGEVLPPEYLEIFASKNKVNIINERKYKPIYTYKAVFNLPKEYLHSVQNLASSILPEDNDTILRRYMPVVQLQDKLYPSLALSAYSMYTGIKDFVLTDKYLCSNDNCKTLKIPIEQAISKDYLGNKIDGVYAKISWYTPTSQNYSYKKYSAIDVIKSYNAIKEGKEPILSKDVFKDKIVIVGLNADKNIWEQLSETPILKRQSDLDIHATVISNMLNNTFNVENHDSSVFIITFLFSLFIIFGFKKFRLNILFATVLSLVYFAYFITQFVANVYVAPITPILTVYLACILKKIYNLLIIDKNSELVKRAMGKYVSKDVMKQVLANLDKLKVGGIRSVVTILFVDIRNFTQISEKLPPQDVTSLLNEYFATIEPIIAKYHGVINKYMGDGVLAVFGEPIKNEEHALNAIKCAYEIKQEVKILREKLLNEGKSKIQIGIGINTGDVFAGNIGTDERLEYTVIGDNVNLAYRIETYNQLLKTDFLISQYTYEYVKDYVDVVKLSQVEIKGKSKPIDIYEVLKIRND